MTFLASAVLISLVAAVSSAKHQQQLSGPKVSASFAKRDHLAIHVPDIPTEYRANMSAYELWALNAFGEPRSSSLENELWTSPGYCQFAVSTSLQVTLCRQTIEQL